MPLIHTFPPPPRPSTSKNAQETESDMNGTMHHQASSSASSPRASSSQPLTNGSRMSSASSRHSQVMDIEEDEESDSDEEEDYKPVVHVEVRMNPNDHMDMTIVRQSVYAYIQSNSESLFLASELSGWEDLYMFRDRVERIWVAEIPGLDESVVSLCDVHVHVHVYRPSVETSVSQFSAVTEDDDEDDETRVPAASVRELPSMELDGLWDTLIYADDIKARLLNYIASTTSFSDAEIDFNVVTWNRMVLLHGPPGTGKTSLCRALAQKLLIRLSHKYRCGKIVEINSHSLFSKWFSESGKLVQKLFSAVHEMVDEEDCFVVVMIDEVESLTAARASAMNGNEPGDAVRVVNALLTQLDKLKVRKNVLVMTTSNIAGAIDPAFVDRADIKELVGLPPPQAIYWILSSCLRQLMQGGLVKNTRIADWEFSNRVALHPSSSLASQKLHYLAVKCYEGQLAGRFLRRLPVLAHSRYIAPRLQPGDAGCKSLKKWVEAMTKVVEDEVKSKGEIALADGHWKKDIGTQVAVKVEPENTGEL